jgi:hypothetical protein
MNWPALDFAQLKDTVNTVQLWAQIVGKIRLRKMPWINHSWHVPFYISSRGLSTHAIPFEGGVFQMDFDFIDHVLIISTSTGLVGRVDLYPRSVADFYAAVFDQLRLLSIEVHIYGVPNEMADAIPFKEDGVHHMYDPIQMNTLWQALLKAHVVFTRFRAGFTGKVSPVHLFWGAFDLAVTRFSGRPAPPHPGGIPHIPDSVMREAYSHEVSSAGFWPGSDSLPEPAFYSYCYPTPPDFPLQAVVPSAAHFDTRLGEFILPYEVVRTSPDPEAVLLAFLNSTYQAAAKTGHWDPALVCDLTRFEK